MHRRLSLIWLLKVFCCKLNIANRGWGGEGLILLSAPTRKYFFLEFRLRGRSKNKNLDIIRHLFILFDNFYPKIPYFPCLDSLNSVSFKLNINIFHTYSCWLIIHCLGLLRRWTSVISVLRSRKWSKLGPKIQMKRYLNILF